MITSRSSTRPFGRASAYARTLFYRSYEPVASVACLAPLYLPRRATRPVSYYAFFKGLLL